MTTLNLKQIDVLIIDDEKDICYLLGNLLRKKRLQSEYVNSLKDAANMLEKNEPDIIFLDNHLPDGMGVNFISYIKRFHPLSKIIMITAHDNVADKQKAFKEGVDYFLSKPFSKETINGIMETLAH
ncbi:MAG: response regulator [Ferruginibacter sp.]|uniref:response regulator n=1 Tax=Ferruginibacter sp. TaxID=1940288 RepID=UPI0026592EA1|nr:response regulator [Ferruginibacter sp.]MDB5278456.1 response regulator [Ferruginibacter sp.]